MVRYPRDNTPYKLPYFNCLDPPNPRHFSQRREPPHESGSPSKGGLCVSHVILTIPYYLFPIPSVSYAEILIAKFSEINPNQMHKLYHLQKLLEYRLFFHRV